MKLQERLACLTVEEMDIHIKHLEQDQSLILTLRLKIRHTEQGQFNRQPYKRYVVSRFNAYKGLECGHLKFVSSIEIITFACRKVQGNLCKANAAIVPIGSIG